MNRLALISLAASALVPVAAGAQTTVQPPVKWEDSPNARLRVPAAPAPTVRPAPAPGVSWQHRRAPAPMPPAQSRAHAPAPSPHVQHHAAPRAAPHVAPHGQVQVRRHEAPPVVQHGQPQGPGREMRRHEGQAPMVHGGGPEMQRDVLIRRGGDRMARRHQGINRYYGDEGDYEDRGMPLGRGQHRDDRDYDWAEGPHEPPYGYGYHQQGYAQPGYGYAYPGYGYGYGYGYGSGYGGGMVVTETTVTTSPTVIQETVYEEVVHSAPKRKYPPKGRRISSKTRCVC